MQDLLDALKSGETSESKLWTVLTAYKENGAYIGLRLPMLPRLAKSRQQLPKN